MQHSLSRLSALLPLCLLAAALPVPSEPVALPMRPVAIDLGPQAMQAVSRLFTSDLQFEDYFQQRAPAIDFTRESLVYYSAGLQPTSGYVATIDSVVPSEGGHSLAVRTTLVTPGPQCDVEPRRTLPHELVAIPALRAQPAVARFAHDHSIAICAGE